MQLLLESSWAVQSTGDSFWSSSGRTSLTHLKKHSLYCLHLFSRVGNQCTVICEQQLSHQYPSSLGLRDVEKVSALSGLHVYRRHPPCLRKPRRALLIGRSVGRSTPPWLTPFVTLHDSETYPQTLTFAIIPVCRALSIIVNFSGHPYFLSSCYWPVLPTISNALLKSTKTMYSGRSCSMHFFSCRR